jgi:hypothetical protein
VFIFPLGKFKFPNGMGAWDVLVERRSVLEVAVWCNLLAGTARDKKTTRTGRCTFQCDAKRIRFLPNPDFCRVDPGIEPIERVEGHKVLPLRDATPRPCYLTELVMCESGVCPGRHRPRAPDSLGFNGTLTHCGFLACAMTI